MTSSRRQAIERQEEAESRDRALLWLVVLCAISGVAGLVGFLAQGERSWPKPLAFGWCAVFATGLVLELVRRRRAARRRTAARAGRASGR